jgi:glycosyltransferase involved in cell wall biosynthesis
MSVATAAAREPIRVAYMIDTFDVGGTELNAIRTLEALDSTRFETTVFHLQAAGPLRARYEALGVRMVYLPISGFRSPQTLWQALRLAMLLRRLHIQVVHCHDVYTNIFAAPWARVLGRCGVLASRRWLFEVPRPELNALNRWSYRFAHRVLANSASVVRLLTEQESIAADKIVEIPNFLGPEAFGVQEPGQRLEALRQWGIPDGAFVVGIVARLAPVKNHALLFRAVQAMGDDTHLVLIGDGGERRSLQILAEELGIAARVHFLGTIVSADNTHQYFDVSVLCSRSEGFPNTIIEALAARRPVVATRVGGVVDVVDDGVTGLLVPSEDVAALTQALQRLRADPELRTRLGAAGEQRVSSDYSQQNVMSKLQKLYIQLTCYGRRQV